MYLYITSDRIGTPTGGGAVTYHESEALKTLGRCQVWGRDQIGQPPEEPWGYDLRTQYLGTFPNGYSKNLYREDFQLAHFYAGTFTNTVNNLKRRGTKITYTAAAHSKEDSQDEHRRLGTAFDYPHLTDPSQWERYVGGYLESDLLIVPSRHSEECMRRYGHKGTVKIIPHGCELPNELRQRPDTFTVGYLGAIGPDKGLIYLLQAWKQLGYTDGSTLVIGGAHSTSPYLMKMIQDMNCQNVRLLGWIDNVSDFYHNINVYVQPSVTEGFGIEVLEAMAHARPVICSSGAGAADLVPSAWCFQPRDVDTLVQKVDLMRMLEKDGDKKPLLGWQDIAKQFTWSKVREMYCKAWKELL